MRKCWIAAATSAGQFSSESLVELSTSDGKVITFFIDNTMVKGEGRNAKIEVTHIYDNEDGKTQHCLLPTEAYETQSPWVDVALQ